MKIFIPIIYFLITIIRTDGYNLPDIRPSKTHRWSVDEIDIKPSDLKNTWVNGNYQQLYSVQVNFSKPRNSDELYYKNSYYRFFYRVWEVTYGNSIMVNENYISGNRFEINRLEEGKYYFIRIFTLIDRISENLSTLKFFINSKQDRNQFRVFDHYPLIPSIHLQLWRKLPNSYSLILNLDGPESRDKIYSFYFIIQKNNQQIETRSLNKDTKHVYFNIAYEPWSEYIIQVYTVFINQRNMASEYSNRIFFQIF
ncbi:uncharacterized protein LOC135927464 [Gordionus sp. m RMFG-2023]|uniref:uncharacterized protein LOC135927464 n=1 Tax=Gordionus sp. m RMFG-2023 TaxID=3053472 RepID=UPI0031FC8696